MGQVMMESKGTKVNKVDILLWEARIHQIILTHRLGAGLTKNFIQVFLLQLTENVKELIGQ